jgi:uncharacterized protein YqgV (UPF0045/DUF77 family)
MGKGSIAVQVLPLNAGDKKDVYLAVDKAIEVIRNAGVHYEVGPFETTMEGDVQHLLDIAYRAHRAVKDAGIKSVITYIKMAESDEPSTISEKVDKYRA